MLGERTLIAGTGMAAWGAWYRLKAEGASARIVDRNPYPGGHTASHESNGFVFDEGPHISFSSDDRVKQILADAVGGDFETPRADVDNYFRGHRIQHPAIAYLHGLPTDLVTACIRDFVAVLDADDTAPANYAEWLLATYGETFARTFPFTYGKKYHTLDAELMNTEWLGPRLYRADLDEVLRGALAPAESKLHYIDKFRYPKKGGFGAYLHQFFDGADFELGKEIVAVDPHAKSVTFADGEVYDYDSFISSIPLPDLIKMMPAPAEVAEAAALLSCSQCVIVNIGLPREDISPTHWCYVYDEDMASVRLSFPHMFSKSVVPPGHGAIQVEVYYSDKYKPLDHPIEDDIETVIADLRRMNIIREDDEIVHKDAKFIPYANVIFDLDSGPATKTVHAYLDECGIDYCGRYGDWAYIWTDESFKSGESAAQKALDRT